MAATKKAPARRPRKPAKPLRMAEPAARRAKAEATELGDQADAATLRHERQARYMDKIRSATEELRRGILAVIRAGDLTEARLAAATALARYEDMRPGAGT